MAVWDMMMGAEVRRDDAAVTGPGEVGRRWQMRAWVPLAGWLLVRSVGEGTPYLAGVVLLAAPVAIAGFVSAEGGASGARRRS